MPANLARFGEYFRELETSLRDLEIRNASNVTTAQALAAAVGRTESADDMLATIRKSLPTYLEHGGQH
jgi:hypothetical protein